MKKAKLSLIFVAWAVMIACGATRTFGADPPVKSDRKDPAKISKDASDLATFRSTKLMGMKVRNADGEDLGKIKDLVIDVDRGQVRYAALSFGGFLGLGDKLFAVPMRALRLAHKDNETHFVLHVNKDRLKNAPGFSDDAWPDFANPAWGAEVDAFYGTDTVSEADTHEGTFLAAKDGSFTMKTDNKEHAHRLGPKVRVTIDGAAGRLVDIKTGSHIKVTTGKHDGKDVAVSVDARSPGR